MTVGCNISNRTPFNFLRNKYLFVSFYLVIYFSEIHIHCLQFKLTYLCLLKFIDIDIDYLFKYCTLRASAQLFISLFIVIIALHFSHALVYSSYIITGNPTHVPLQLVTFQWLITFVDLCMGKVVLMYC